MENVAPRVTTSDIRIAPRRVIWPLIIMGSFGCLGMGLLSLQLPAAVKLFQDSKHTLRIRGLFEEVVRSDWVNASFSVRVAGNQLTPLYEEANAHIETLRRYFLQSGLREDDLSVGVPDLVDNRARHSENYGDMGRPMMAMSTASANSPSVDTVKSCSETTPMRYFVTISLNIQTPKVELCRRLLQNAGQLLKLGVPITGSNARYEYTKFGENRITMLNKAFQNAQEAAQGFATVTGTRLGKIAYADQGFFQIDDGSADGTGIDKKIRVVVNVAYLIDKSESPSGTEKSKITANKATLHTQGTSHAQNTGFFGRVKTLLTSAMGQ